MNHIEKLLNAFYTKRGEVVVITSVEQLRDGVSRAIEGLNDAEFEALPAALQEWSNAYADAVNSTKKPLDVGLPSTDEVAFFNRSFGKAPDEPAAASAGTPANLSPPPLSPQVAKDGAVDMTAGIAQPPQGETITLPQGEDLTPPPASAGDAQAQESPPPEKAARRPRKSKNGMPPPPRKDGKLFIKYSIIAENPTITEEDAKKVFAERFPDGDFNDFNSTRRYVFYWSAIFADASDELCRAIDNHFSKGENNDG